ncbi:hypothetical protein OHC33_005636 [Knufia fluminis]|uniref:Uncharacterized protein n=1 Tax=Knufia fluminis TaxID=191047 RepID=A0AAN8EVE6_9EURO|nr:hypothetical protein OHC33_005636 [Knufia fluminis]
MTEQTTLDNTRGWYSLSTELRARILDFLFTGLPVRHKSVPEAVDSDSSRVSDQENWDGPGVFNILVVSKSFITPEEVHRAVVANAEITLATCCDTMKVASLMDERSKRLLKTLALDRHYYRRESDVVECIDFRELQQLFGTFQIVYHSETKYAEITTRGRLGAALFGEYHSHQARSTSAVDLELEYAEGSIERRAAEAVALQLLTTFTRRQGLPYYQKEYRFDPVRNLLLDAREAGVDLNMSIEFPLTVDNGAPDISEDDDDEDAEEWEYKKSPISNQDPDLPLSLSFDLMAQPHGMSDLVPRHWTTLPTEIRDRILDLVLENRTFTHLKNSTGASANVNPTSVLKLIKVSRQFATYHDIVNAILRSGKIKINDISDIGRISPSLTPEQRHMMKTLTVSQQFLEGIGSVPTTIHTFPGSIGNFRLDVPNMLEVYLSVSEHSSIAKMTKRKPDEPSTSIDWADDLAKGYVSFVEAQSVLLEACLKNYTSHQRDFTGLGALLSYAAKNKVGVQAKITMMFIERDTRMKLAEVYNAVLSTKDWCIRVPFAGQEICLEQEMSRDCFDIGATDLRSAMAILPRRWWAMLVLPHDEYKWLLWYETLAMPSRR